MLQLWPLFPGLVPVWSDIVQRKVWKEARSVECINKACINVNRALGHFIARNGAVVVQHRELKAGTEAWMGFI